MKNISISSLYLTWLAWWAKRRWKPRAGEWPLTSRIYFDWRWIIQMGQRWHFKLYDIWCEKHIIIKRMLSLANYGLRFAQTCKKTCCWNCHLEQPHKDCEFFCKNCHKLLPVNIDNYFTLFDQPKSFNIDLKKLEKSYKGYQRQVHPDRFFHS